MMSSTRAEKFLSRFGATYIPSFIVHRSAAKTRFLGALQFRGAHGFWMRSAWNLQPVTCNLV
jgi:hypothetical protein